MLGNSASGCSRTGSLRAEDRKMRVRLGEEEAFQRADEALIRSALGGVNPSKGVEQHGRGRIEDAPSYAAKEALPEAY
jgi:hypothetical protein